MIVDFHTHAFPDEMAEKTMRVLKRNSGTEPYSNGTYGMISDTARKAGIDLSVVMPVVTNPSSARKINAFAAYVNERTAETGVMSFAGIHPDIQDIKEEFRFIRENGFKGIKIHPSFQHADLDDLRYKRIIGFAEELGLITVCHGGLDIGVEGDWAVPEKAANLIRDVRPKRLVLAHMGGWAIWEDVKKYLCGKDVYFDTSFCCNKFNYRDEIPAAKRYSPLTKEGFTEIVKLHGSDKILFGSDSPWGDTVAQLNFIKSLPDDLDLPAVLGGNAARLLGI